MNSTIPIPPDLNLNADPELQALAAELKQSVETAQMEFETEQHTAQTEAAAAEPVPSLPAPPEPDPAQFAAWDAIGSLSGLPVDIEREKPEEPKGGPHHAAEELLNLGTEEILEHRTKHALKSVAERLAGSDAHHKKRPQPQWHYAKRDQKVGPVAQEELLKLLEAGALPWNTLVWNRTLSGWTSADETELAALMESASPPPLPAASQTPIKTQRADLICPACGQTANANDRFCSGCGQPFSP